MIHIYVLFRSRNTVVISTRWRIVIEYAVLLFIGIEINEFDRTFNIH